MRLSLVLTSALALLFPSVLCGTGTHVPVRVTVRVPLVAAVDGPAQVVLAPGEAVRIRVSVMANVPWILGINSPNAFAREPAPLTGLPGSAIANSREVDICCSPQASGPQTIALVYTLMPR